MIESKAYRLFAMRSTEENAAEAMQMRFQRITPKYILMYDTETPKRALEITEENLSAMSNEDMEWLSNCNMTLLKEFEQEHMSAIQKSREVFMQEFERELQVEKEKMNDGKQQACTTE